jgi:hypothetical protein
MRRTERTLQVDLHGHDVLTAVDLALRRVQEAQQNGYNAVELVHGAADVEDPVEDGRGRIKWELRRQARTGRFNRWADPSRTWPKAGSLILYLWPNGRSRRESWSDEPRRRHR